MRIPLDRKKYRRQLVLQAFSLVAIVAALTALVVLNTQEDGWTATRVLVALGLAGLAVFFGVMIAHIVPLRKRDGVIVVENGELSDYTKLLLVARNIPVAHVASLEYHSTYRGIRSYLLVVRKPEFPVAGAEDERDSYYLTDFLVDTAELEKLCELLRAQGNAPMRNPIIH